MDLKLNLGFLLSERLGHANFFGGGRAFIETPYSHINSSQQVKLCLRFHGRCVAGDTPGLAEKEVGLIVEAGGAHVGEVAHSCTSNAQERVTAHLGEAEGIESHAP